MLPSQAPPAHVAHTNQSALDRLQRMRDIQVWILEQQAALPGSIEGTDSSLAPFLAALDAFWDASVEHKAGQPAVPRRQALALLLAQAADDDAALRHNDGTLSAEDLLIARAVRLPPGGPLSSHLHASELLVGTRPYAGALVLQDDRDPARVLLFTVETGWRVFASLDVLYRDVELGMRRQLAQRDELPGIGMDDMEAVIDTHFLDTRPIDGDAFDTLTRRLVERLRERVTLAFATPVDEERQDALHAALDLHALLDVHGIVRDRDLSLATRLDEERLAGQPKAVRDHWRRMAADYRDSAYRARDLQSSGTSSLDAFILDALATALRDRGIAVSPRDVRVRLTRRTLENGPIATALSGFARQELSLLELAYRNLGDTDGLEVIHADGSLRTDIPAPVVRKIVRDLDLPNAYARHLESTLGDTPQGRGQRRTFTGLLKARMAFEAADARLSYYDGNEPRSFHPDHRERGFAWVKAVLDHPASTGRARVEGHEIVIHQLTYQGAALTGLFLIGARQSGAVARVVLYTPDAPDGLAWREFADRATLTRDFLLNRRFEHYLLAHLPDELGEADPARQGSRRFRVPRFNDDRSASWIFSTGSCQGCTELAEKFHSREVATDIFDRAYDDLVALAKRNASDVARSTANTDVGAARDVLWHWNLPVQLTRELVGGVIRSVPQTAQAAWRFYDNVKAGERTEAFLAFVDGYTAGLAVLPLYSQVPVLTGAYVRATAGSRVLASNRSTLSRPDTLFDKRFLAKDVVIPPGESMSVFHVVEHAGVKRGIIRHEGKSYHVRYDTTHDSWRLFDAGNPGRHGPPVERLADGTWRFRRGGLAGGGGGSSRHARLPTEDPLFLLSDNELLNADVARLTTHQRGVLLDTLYRDLAATDYDRVLKHMLGREPAPHRLSSTQRQAWNDALQAGTWAPAEAPVAPRLPIDPPGLPAGTAPRGASRLPRLTTVDQSWWPQHVYAYLPGQISGQGTEVVSVALQELRVSRGLHVGIPVTTLPPTTPLSSLPTGLTPWIPRAAGTTANSTLGSASGRWVRIDLHTLMRRSTTPRSRSYQLFRIDETDAYLLRPVNRHNLHANVDKQTSVRFSGNEFEIGSMP